MKLFQTMMLDIMLHVFGSDKKTSLVVLGSTAERTWSKTAALVDDNDFVSYDALPCHPYAVTRSAEWQKKAFYEQATFLGMRLSTDGGAGDNEEAYKACVRKVQENREAVEKFYLDIVGTTQRR